MVKVRFFTIGGTFATAKIETFASDNEALLAVRQYAKDYRFTNVREVDEDNETRVTATTPNGRHGRNIAVIEYNWEEKES